MKIRSGFVSNSSSSSFIVAIPKDSKKVHITVNTTVDLLDHVEEVLKTKKEVIRYFTNVYGLDNCSEEWLEKCFQAIKEGQEILVGSVSDENELDERILVDNDFINNAKFDDDNIKVIHKETGY